MMKSIKYVVTLLVIAFLIVGCAAQPTEETVVEEPTEEVTVEGKVCVILDSGGVDDKGFNQSAWEGAQEAAAMHDWEAVYLESRQQADFEKNINEFLKSDCTLIVTIGFLLGDATASAAEANPDQLFMIQDFAYDPSYENVWAQLFAMQEGAFLAGYLAAGMTQAGIVGGFGGMNIPPVADFFIGMADGINYYNDVHGTDVQQLGWSNETLDGLFVGSFTDTEAAKRYTENLIDEGADIILPQSGPEALAAAAVMNQRGGVLAIGADADQFLADTVNGSVYLTTIMKNLGVTIVDAVQQIVDGTFTGGTYVATLADGGLNLSSFHDHDSEVPDELKAELEQLRQDVIDGKISINNWASLSAGE